MSSGCLSRRLGLPAGGAAVVAMATLSACGSDKTHESPQPGPVAPGVRYAPALAVAHRKAAGASGPNSFTPTINPKPRVRFVARW